MGAALRRQMDLSNRDLKDRIVKIRALCEREDIPPEQKIALIYQATQKQKTASKPHGNTGGVRQQPASGNGRLVYGPGGKLQGHGAGSGDMPAPGQSRAVIVAGPGIPPGSPPVPIGARPAAPVAAPVGSERPIVEPPQTPSEGPPTSPTGQPPAPGAGVVDGLAPGQSRARIVGSPPPNQRAELSQSEAGIASQLVTHGLAANMSEFDGRLTGAPNVSPSERLAQLVGRERADDILKGIVKEVEKHTHGGVGGAEDAPQPEPEIQNESGDTPPANPAEPN